MTPASSGSWSRAVRTGSVLWRARMSPRWLGRVGSRCWAMTMGAAKAGGSVATSVERASMPPADAPMTTRWEMGRVGEDIGTVLSQIADHAGTAQGPGWEDTIRGQVHHVLSIHIP